MTTVIPSGGDPETPTVGASTVSTPLEVPTTVAPRSGRATLRGHVAIMRPDHWVKQVFVLPGIVAALSGGTADIPGGLLVRLVVGMTSVCLVSSSNYVINEVLDAPSDRPVRCSAGLGGRSHACVSLICSRTARPKRP